MNAHVLDSLQQAMAHQQSGRFDQAEQIYRSVLSTDPNCNHAWHLLGLLTHQRGQSEAGAQMIERAVQLGLHTVEVLTNLGECYRHLGRHSEAIAAFRAAIQLNPNQVETINGLCMVYLAHQQYAEALPLFERIVELRPNDVSVRHGYGAALALAGRMDDAIGEWERALALDPNHQQVLRDLGVNLQSHGRLDEALKTLAMLVERHPGYAQGYADYAEALLVAGRIDEGIAFAQRGVELAPAQAESHHTLGRAYRIGGQYDAALTESLKALELNPNFLLPLGNIVLIGEAIHSYSRLIEWLEKAVEKMPDHVAFWIAISESHSREGQIEKSIEVLDRALTHQPNHPDLRLSRSIRLFSAGRFLEAFKDYSSRQVLQLYEAMVKNAGKTMWDGSDPAGKHLFVYAEQGFGDIIQFARYLPMLVERGMTLTIGTGREEICPLLRAIPGVTEVVVGESTLGNHEFHIALMSLPCIFKTTLETVPNRVPYIHADESKIQQWKPMIDAHARGLKVGMVWGGRGPSDPRRVCTIKDLSILSDVPNVSWYSLQTDQPREQLKDAPVEMNILDVGRDLKDFSDTAAVIAQLDLVISIDTATVHLAGAMGKKTWLMLPYFAEWRWFDQGDTSPWYPTMKLFRQKKINDWSDVVQSIRRELIELSSGQKN